MDAAEWTLTRACTTLLSGKKLPPRRSNQKKSKLAQALSNARTQQGTGLHWILDAAFGSQETWGRQATLDEWLDVKTRDGTLKDKLQAFQTTIAGYQGSMVTPRAALKRRCPPSMASGMPGGEHRDPEEPEEDQEEEQQDEEQQEALEDVAQGMGKMDLATEPMDVDKDTMSEGGPVTSSPAKRPRAADPRAESPRLLNMVGGPHPWNRAFGVQQWEPYQQVHGLALQSAQGLPRIQIRVPAPPMPVDELTTVLVGGKGMEVQETAIRGLVYSLELPPAKVNSLAAASDESFKLIVTRQKGPWQHHVGGTVVALVVLDESVYSTPVPSGGGKKKKKDELKPFSVDQVLKALSLPEFGHGINNVLAKPVAEGEEAGAEVDLGPAVVEAPSHLPLEEALEVAKDLVILALQRANNLLAEDDFQEKRQGRCPPPPGGPIRISEGPIVGDLTATDQRFRVVVGTSEKPETGGAYPISASVTYYEAEEDQGGITIAGAVTEEVKTTLPFLYGFIRVHGPWLAPRFVSVGKRWDGTSAFSLLITVDPAAGFTTLTGRSAMAVFAVASVAALFNLEPIAAFGISAELAADGSLIAVDALGEKTIGAARFKLNHLIFPAANGSNNELMALGPNGSSQPVLVPKKAKDTVTVRTAATVFELLELVGLLSEDKKQAKADVRGATKARQASNLLQLLGVLETMTLGDSQLTIFTMEGFTVKSRSQGPASRFVEAQGRVLDQLVLGNRGKMKELWPGVTDDEASPLHTDLCEHQAYFNHPTVPALCPSAQAVIAFGLALGREATTGGRDLTTVAILGYTDPTNTMRPLPTPVSHDLLKGLGPNVKCLVVAEGQGLNGDIKPLLEDDNLTIKSCGTVFDAAAFLWPPKAAPAESGGDTDGPCFDKSEEGKGSEDKSREDKKKGGKPRDKKEGKSESGGGGQNTAGQKQATQQLSGVSEQGSVGKEGETSASAPSHLSQPQPGASSLDTFYRQADASYDVIGKRVAPLTQAQEAEVMEIFKASNLQEVLVNKYNVGMTRDKLRSLREGVWLNDEVIDFYFQLLLTRDEQLREQEADHKACYFFNSQFMCMLLESEKYTYDKVRRWTKNFDIFTMDKLFFPVNERNRHWGLAVVYMEEKKIQYYDSLKGAPRNARKYTNGLKRYLADEHEDKKGKRLEMEGWELVVTQDSTPQQANDCDCGVFATCFADLLAENLPVHMVNQKDMFHFRKRMALCIVKGTLDI